MTEAKGYLYDGAASRTVLHLPPTCAPLTFMLATVTVLVQGHGRQPDDQGMMAHAGGIQPRKQQRQRG